MLHHKICQIPLDKGYTFIHVNKCGGKSINDILSKYSKDYNLIYQEVHGLVGRPVTKKTPGKLILFVRDPIDRFISSYWYFRRNHYLPDLNDLVEEICDNDYRRNEVFNRNLHFGYSLSSYLVNVDDLDFYFVGTTENIKQDVQKLMKKISDENSTPNEYTLYHLNRTKRKNKKLSKKSVNFLKKFYERDYFILNKLHEKGYLTKEYIDRINNRVDFIY